MESVTIHSSSQQLSEALSNCSNIPVVNLEQLEIRNFKNYDEFFSCFTALCTSRKTQQRPPATSMTYNVFSANLAHANPEYKAILQSADILRCDGVGALLGSRIAGDPIHTRLTNALYFTDMLAQLSSRGLTVFLLGGKPGVAEAAIQKISSIVPQHSIVGCYHGYLSRDPEASQTAIELINHLKPDVVIVGMGMPIQEFWIAENKEKLNCGILFAVGALIDYYGDAQYRCSPFFQRLGLEWLTRLVRYPVRMFSRYVIGKPYYIWRISKLALGRLFS